MEEEKEGYLLDILNQFQIKFKGFESHGTGLINSTWKVFGEDKNYILQRINNNVFKHPGDIDFNIQLIDKHLNKYHPDYFFVAPIKTKSGSGIYFSEKHGWFRVSPFVEDSVTIVVVQTPEQAYEAAFQFGKFTGVLSDLDATKLKITIPDFHNLELRYEQFLTAMNNGNNDRRKESEEYIQKLLAQAEIVKDFKQKISNHAFRKRVTHHDTKISNVLFDQNYKGMCVIDLDTVMPGYFFSDVGDMMRTYLSPVSEEEKDFSRITIRKEFFNAVVDGYSEAMKGELSKDEMNSFIFAGKFMIYMQALRFLTDYLNNDIYYGSKYPGHNFVRAGNQIRLLEEMEQLEK